MRAETKPFQSVLDFDHTGVQRLYRIEGRTSPAHPAQKAADFREMSTRLIQFILQL